MTRIGKTTEKTKQAGFSLLEIMIAIVILALIGGISMGSFGRTAQRAKVERGASRLAHELKAARAKSISLNRDVKVTMSDNGRTITIWIDDDRDKIEESDEIEVVSLGESTEISVSSSWTSCWFTPIGQFVSTQQSRTIATQTTTVNSLNGLDTATVTIGGGGTVQMRLSPRS